MEYVNATLKLGRESTRGVYAIIDLGYVMDFVFQVEADTAEAAVTRIKEYQDAMGNGYLEPVAVPIGVMQHN